MKYTVFAATPEDINSGWVWLGSPTLPSRIVVRITNKKAGKSVYCEALQIDDNFLNIYNVSGRIPICKPDEALVANAWYRKRLGPVETQSAYELEVEFVDNFRGRLRSCLQHPQTVIRLATWLGIMSVGLGILGVVLGLIGVWVGIVR
jgi:hypothetical protein